MLATLWYQVQTDPFYKNNTTFIVTTDHGRGRKSTSWTTHGFWAKGSGDIWLAMLGSGVPATGEMKTAQRIWQNQIAATIAQLAGIPFTTRHANTTPVTLQTEGAERLTSLAGQ
jgi:hypothetical protein